jgi:8-oxo-dGTP diphosphatase
MSQEEHMPIRSDRSSRDVISIHVVAGVVEDETGRVLVSRRPQGKVMAGAWEFPGGKLVPGESRLAGLKRELDEELSICVHSARPLIRYCHSYPDLEVDLDLWRVTRWSGEPGGREGQAINWCMPSALSELDLLPADGPAVTAIRLPSVCAVTPHWVEGDSRNLLDQLEQVAKKEGVGLVCIRQPGLNVDALLDIASGAACRLEGTGAQLLMHGDVELLGQQIGMPCGAYGARFSDVLAGLHAPGHLLDRISRRPVPESMWFGVSCHDSAQLDAACNLGADYVFLGPVKPTSSHPGAPCLGWARFAELVERLPLPVFAIGGLSPLDLEDAWAAGAQGIAAISSLWPK